MMNEIILALKFCRAKFLPVSVFPVAAGYFYGLRIYAHSDHQVINFIILIFATMLIHLFANGVNDYFDFKKGLEPLIKHDLQQKPGDEQGGSKLLTDGIISPHKAETILAVIFGLISIFAFYLLLTMGFKIIIFGITGVLLGYFYSSPPFKLSYRGYGEIVIFICFGLLPFYTGYYLRSGRIDLHPLLPSSVFGLFTVIILYFHHFGHYKQDAKVGKRNIIVIIGVNWGKKVFVLILISIIILIILNAYLGNFNAFSLALIIPVMILIHKLGQLNIEKYDEVYAYLNTVILTNFISSIVLISAILISSEF